MGEWSETCALTHMPIFNGNDAYAFLLLKSPYESSYTCNICESFTPLCLPIRGKYNGIGSIENIVEDRATEMVLRNLHFHNNEGNPYAFQNIEQFLFDVADRGSSIYLDWGRHKGRQVNIVLCHAGAVKTIQTTAATMPAEDFGMYGKDMDDWNFEKAISHMLKSVYNEAYLKACEKMQTFGFQKNPRYFDLFDAYCFSQASVEDMHGIQKLHENNFTDYFHGMHTAGFDMLSLYDNVIHQENCENLMKQFHEYALFYMGCSEGRLDLLGFARCGGDTFYFQKALAMWTLEFCDERDEKEFNEF